VTTGSIYENWLLDHRNHAADYDRVVSEIELVLQGGQVIVLMLLGQSGVGKTELLKDVAERFAEHVSDSGHPKILYVPFPTGATPDLLAERIIKQILGLPIVKWPRRELRDRARNLLRTAGVLVVILDETNHAAEARSKQPVQTKTNRQIADWIKEVKDLARVSFLMGGLSHSRRLLKDNEQLEGRALRPIDLAPYAWHVEEQRAAYAEMVAGFVGHARDEGWTVEIDHERLVRASYLCTGGLVGNVARLFARATVLSRSTKRMTAEVLAQAFATRFPERRGGNPFELDQITDEMLNGAHREVLERARSPFSHGRRTAGGARD
jgi:hypothetical protein